MGAYPSPPALIPKSVSPLTGSTFRAGPWQKTYTEDWIIDILVDLDFAEQREMVLSCRETDQMLICTPMHCNWVFV